MATKTKEDTREYKAAAAASTKGGGGKSTVSTILGFLAGANKVLIVQLDTHNAQTPFSNSKRVEGQSFRAKDKELDAGVTAIGRTIFGADNDTLCVIDMGGGDDSVETIKALVRDGIEFDAYIPLTPDPETVKNALDTAASLPKDTRKFLVFNNFSNLRQDFWFIFGEPDYGIAGDLGIFKAFDYTLEVPRSRLFGIAKMFQTSIWDLAEIQNTYDYGSKRKELAALKDDSFEQFMSSHRLSVACDELLQSIAATQKEAQKWS